MFHLTRRAKTLLYIEELAGHNTLNTLSRFSVVFSWVQLGGGHGGRVPHFSRRWGYNIAYHVSPIFFFFGFVLGEISKIKMTLVSRRNVTGFAVTLAVTYSETDSVKFKDTSL